MIIHEGFQMGLVLTAMLFVVCVVTAAACWRFRDEDGRATYHAPLAVLVFLVLAGIVVRLVG